MRAFEYGGFWLSRGARSRQYKRTWFDAGTRQTRRSSLGRGDFSDLERAKDALIAYVQANRKLVNEAPDTVPAALIFTKYLTEHVPTVRSAPALRTETAFWLEEFPDRMASEIVPEAIETFIAKLRARGLSDGYIDRIMDTGRAAFNRARRLQQLREVPFIRAVETAADKRNKDPLGQPLDLDQAVALLDAAAAVPHMLKFNMILACTMCRPEAALDLGQRQINRGADVIDLNPPGRKQTRKHRPVVPIARALRPFLESEAPRAWPERRQRPAIITDRLVTFAGYPVKSVKTAWRALRIAAKLPEGITPYSWRHGMGRVLRAARVPSEQIDIMLGHIRGGTTTIYAPFDPDYCREAVAAIDAHFDLIRETRMRKAARG